MEWVRDLVSSAINDLLGEYVEVRNLQVSLYGTASLKDLEFKPSALEKMELPVIVKKGFIGSVHASLPLTNLKGKSAQISISDIFILSGPNPSKVKSSPKETEETLYLTKMRQLQMASLMGSDMPDVTKDEKETGWYKKKLNEIIVYG
eukprot:TRINITY_DN6380_c0_g2_i6.p1 TRINITY_DN6380_c0_g2~~TRINITY_DN6380_c0_g2_i6.p1  ORF type:complete len:148 (+),score=24.14 TRINITY_DN6380_c0_g2_i6:84-527(+)